MDAEMRKSVEQRAYALWDEAGRPEGSALLYWLRAEQELGIIPKVEADDPLVTLQELAAEAHAWRIRSFASGSAAAALGRQGCPDPERPPSGRTRTRSANTSKASRKGRRRCPVPRQSRVATRCLAGTKGASRNPPRSDREAAGPWVRLPLIQPIPSRERGRLPRLQLLARRRARADGPAQPRPLRELFERLLALRNDVGLLAEEYDPHSRRQLGNFPQAFSHVGLINTALNLTGG